MQIYIMLLANFKTFQVYSSFNIDMSSAPIIDISKLFKFIVHEYKNLQVDKNRLFQNFSSL